jgi:multiple sugar transport system ATP-binding protein
MNMASVNIRKVEKYFGTTHVIRGVSIDIADGEFCVLVGPSGCGKSTLLRMIAGLEEISEGEIDIGGKVVNDIPPKERDIAMVFQNYALYPHMTVRDNMAFSLMLAKRPKSEIEERVKKAGDILGLVPYLDRYPRQLSGGQRQRVRWAARSCAIRRCSCSTSRCRTSTRSCASRCAPRSRSCTSG